MIAHATKCTNIFCRLSLGPRKNYITKIMIQRNFLLSVWWWCVGAQPVAAADATNFEFFARFLSVFLSIRKLSDLFEWINFVRIQKQLYRCASAWELSSSDSDDTFELTKRLASTWDCPFDVPHNKNICLFTLYAFSFELNTKLISWRKVLGQSSQVIWL